MQIHKLLFVFLVGNLTAGVIAGSVYALDPQRDPNKESRLMLKYGNNAFKAGQYQDAFSAFKKSAQNNYLPAEWKLATMLKNGEGTPKDEQASKKLFEKIARRFEQNPPNRRELPYYVNSLVELGHYAKNGINGKDIDLDLAELFFREAAAVYGNAEAQYQLGRLYSSDRFGKPNLRNAVRWYNLAHQKGHHSAIAELGHMFFYGYGVPENCAKGLALLEYAKNMEQSKQKKETENRILVLYQDALNKANQKQKQDAKKILAAMEPNLNQNTNSLTAANFDE